MLSTKTLATFAAAGALAAALAACSTPTQSATRTGSSDLPAAGWSDSTSATTPEAPAAQLTPADFRVGVVVTEQSCFGTAGCNVTYTIDPQYVGTAPLPDKTTVVFSVSGGEQPQVGNFTIDSDGEATFQREKMISAPEGANLVATVTQIVPGR
ncbi:hypothetical protein SEA_NERGAL_68 [Mycobacterium Phage Nergal]|nr:hypothetical protein SEA_NERGAL_68 [Mycobacterium Phage Nergal]